MKDTIVAIATPRGFGGIGAIRLSGSEALNLVREIFSKNITKPRYAYYGAIFDPKSKTPIDTGIVVYYRAPHSYTGEDVVEIFLHGGIKNLEMVLNILIFLGAKLAERGEFTKRAVENKKMDIFEANAVLELIEAKTEKAVLLASKRLFGAVGSKIQEIKDKIFSIISVIEASIDFPFDVEEVDPQYIKNELEKIENDIKHLLASYKDARVVLNGIRVVIVGKPNVGKSTLLNDLLKYERAIVSEIPGTTRDTIKEVIDFYGVPLEIIDTAGIRETDDKLEKIGVERSKQAIDAGDIVIFVFDGSTQIDEDDLKLIDMTSQKRRIIVLNKTDLPKLTDRETLSRLFPNDRIIEISALLKEGINDVEEVLKEMVFSFDFDSMLITNQIEYDLLNKVLKHIELAKSVLENNTLDIVSEELKDAIEEISSVSLENLSKDVLDGIFSKFCIGK